MKRIVSISMMLLFMIAIVMLDGGVKGLLGIWNAPSLLVVVIITVAILIFSDQLSDFARAFRITLSSRDYTSKELKASCEAVGLTIKTVWLSAVFGFLTGMINMLGSLNDPAALIPGISIALLTVYYAVIINIFLYAVNAKIGKELIYRS